MADYITIGETGLSIRNKLNTLKTTVDSKANISAVNSLNATVATKSTLVNGKIPYNELPKSIITSSYQAFVTKINATSLDLAFGKYNVGNVRNLGRQLAMFGWYSGISKAQAELLTMCEYDTFAQICANATLKSFIINTAVLYTLVTASPYATDILNNTPIGLPDIILYNAGVSTYMNIPTTGTDFTAFSTASNRIEMVKTVTDSANFYTASAVFPFKTTLTNTPFKGYKNIKIQYSASPQTIISGGYRGAALYLSLGGVGINISTVGSGVAVQNNFDLFTTLNNISNMTLSLGVSAFNAGQTYTSQVYIEKIWITEV